MSRKIKASTLRKIKALIKRQTLYNPINFLLPSRIDIAAKTIFARAYLEGNTSNWPEIVYKEHIRSFNNFTEGEPAKNSYKEFKESFINTIESIKSSDSWKHKAPIQIDKRHLVNGSHRTSASIVLGDLVNTISLKDYLLGQYDYNFFRSTRFKNSSISEDVLDAMTIEYVSLKKENIFIAIIFPAAEGFRQEAHDHLLKHGEIVNMRTFKNNEFIPKEVIKQIYFDDKNDVWNTGNDFNNTNLKADFCFDGTGDLTVYVLEANLDESTRIREKEYLRSLWKKDKHSIHITDTYEESNRIVRMFFNDNSRKFMKINRNTEFKSEKMHKLFNEYIKLAPKNILEREKIAIEGSAVLDLMNIREGNDLDYISNYESIDFSTVDIEKHGSEEHRYHSASIDEVLTNPKYFFYYKGYKFVDITEIIKYKESRMINKNKKDADDRKLILSFLKSNKQYSRVV